ncbi:AAA family ATPase [Geobacillus stearothermophilus]|uniref:AAA family ATPase n=1 Tax=Geobacillus stearothermophilus TaxID=1422 RepID=UPI002E247A2F|nr:AAA family ATPase [Geobacillus stearothermophilus]MED3740103.1 AAA family ATPase [Geobacillus stearothermophilus]MED3765958.1 AAA family ATPase [Geobacillus stearothermophilus]MED3773741.1 AAA family ATPase [Geobacillus stearothermophilus]
MIVTEVNSGPKAAYALTGTVLTLSVPEVGSISVDLAEGQQELQRLIDISLDRGYQRLAEGIGAWTVATIVIPPIESEVYETDEVDPETGQPIVGVHRLPLDMSKVQLHLWGLPMSLSNTEEEI